MAPTRIVWLAAVCVWLVAGANYLTAPISLPQGARLSSFTTTAGDTVAQTRLVCPGPETLGVQGLPRSSAQAVSVTGAGVPAALSRPGPSSGFAEGSLALSGIPAGGKWAAPATTGGQVVAGQVSTARSVLVTGAGALAPGTVATQWSWTRTGTSRGLVAAACQPPAASSWLIAGAGAPGRLEHLVLANPGSNPVTVDLSVFGLKGRIESVGTAGLVVAGYARTVILLDAIAGSEPAPVVHVSARGGKVAATLSDAWLDGVVPRGADDVVSTTAPALEQVIAGVPIDGRATVRIGVPGGSEAVVQTRVLTSAGPRRLAVGSVTRVAARSTTDISLGVLARGAYAVQVRADVPVVAAAVVDRRRTRGGPSDFAWSVASPPIKTLAGMALPAAGMAGLTQRLDLAATKDPASVRVTTVGRGGHLSTKDVAIAADSVSTLPLDGATSVWVTPLTGSARAAVLTMASDAGGALLSVTPLADLPPPIRPLPVRQLRD